MNTTGLVLQQKVCDYKRRLGVTTEGWSLQQEFREHNRRVVITTEGVVTTGF